MENKKMTLTDFSRKYFDGLTTENISPNLSLLQSVLKEEFRDSKDFNATLEHVITTLNNLGHELYRLDYDSDIYRYREVWGTQYQDLGANGLEIEFESPDKFYPAWIVCTKNTNEEKK